jgi:hypothetical protein
MNMMMEDEEVVQMIDDDEVENVGIMSGFMDDIEELMEEISEAEMNGIEEGEDADMARMMNRTPDSPEILMNNLRGDMRSIDARREELADLVGMRQAEETPEGVLALLQPVLAQQDAMAAMPMPMPAPQMPPPPMPPMPAQPAGIESITVDETVVPAMYKGGSVQNFNRGSGQMGVTPAQSMSPSGVRYYANGTSDQGVISQAELLRGLLPATDPRLMPLDLQEDMSRIPLLPPSTTPEVTPEVTESLDISELKALLNAAANRDSSQATYAQYLNKLLGQEGSSLPDLETTMKEEEALLGRLGLGTDKNATKSQVLFDIGQAALQFGSNVGSSGQPMRGSAAARLSEALAPLAGKIGARAGKASDEAKALKLLALKNAGDKRATTQASNVALADRQMEAAIELAKLEGKGSEKDNWKTLTKEEATDPNGLHRMSEAEFSTGPWQVSDRGQLKRLGKNASLISNPAEQSLLNKAWNEVQLAEYQEAQKAKSNIQTIDDTYKRIEKLDEKATGLGANIRQQITRTKQLLGIASREDIDKLTDVQLVNAALGQSVFGAITALGIGARGLDTPAERDFLRDVLAGRLTLDKATLLEMTLMRRRQEMKAAEYFNKGLEAGNYDYFFTELGGRATKEKVDIPSTDNFMDNRNKEAVAEILKDFKRTPAGEGDE